MVRVGQKFDSCPWETAAGRRRLFRCAEIRAEYDSNRPEKIVASWPAGDIKRGQRRSRAVWCAWAKNLIPAHGKRQREGADYSGAQRSGPNMIPIARKKSLL